MWVGIGHNRGSVGVRWGNGFGNDLNPCYLSDLGMTLWVRLHMASLFGLEVELV